MAHALTGARTGKIQTYQIAIAALLILRALTAAFLPLSFDESYYWLWSKHLALGYYDHPPLIAYTIAAGTGLFGRHEFAVRSLPLLYGAAASWAVWRAGARLLGSQAAGGLGALLFNLTLMTNAEMMSATPDAPLMLFSSLFVLALAELTVTGDGRYWLAAGAAGGLGLLSKYTALFLGAGALAFLLGTVQGRRWLTSPYPYLGALLAIALFSPDLRWNAAHDWVSFRFQFGKAENAHFAPGHLLELIGGQLLLATPLILVLGVTGLRAWRRRPLLAALCVPALLFFAVHALQARVEGNWPSFLYPVLAIAAADAALHAQARWLKTVARWAGPVALAFVLLPYGQALFAILPIRDPSVRLLAFGFRPVTDQIEAIRLREHAGGLVETTYDLTGWLSFYSPPATPVLAAGEAVRWLSAPLAPPSLLAEPMLYVSEPWRDKSAALLSLYRSVRRVGTVERFRGHRKVETYRIYRLDGFHGVAPLHVVN